MTALPSPPQSPKAAVVTTKELAPFSRLANGLEAARTLSDVLWVVGQEATGVMGLEDCVIYLVDRGRGVCVQSAAYGPKNAAPHLITDPAFPCDLLLSDVYMPGMNGVQLAEQLRAQRPGLRVLFMSGHVDDRAVLEQIRANGDGIVDKPFTTDYLLQLVQSTLASLPA